MHINFECKARCADLEKAEQILKAQNPLFKGEDHQVDTYFNVPTGRLKLREGVIEHALIHYIREDHAGAKQSDVLLYQHQPNPVLKEILSKALGIKVIIDKKRKIYFIDNIKFHFDKVQNLGTFLEIEAIDLTGDVGIEKLKEQCATYISLLGIKTVDFVAVSYSDMLLAKKSS